MTIYEAVNSDKEAVDINEAKGRMAADFVYAFPPDVPVLIPGEEITGEKIGTILLLMEKGARIRGITENRVMVTV